MAVAHGRTQYYGEDKTTLEREFDNIFVLRFDAEGRCAEFTEWYYRKPD